MYLDDVHGQKWQLSHGQLSAISMGIGGHSMAVST